MLTWGESPMANEVPAEWHKKICHANLIFAEQELAGVDDPFEQYDSPKGFQMLLEIDQPAEAERVFQALAENGTIKLPMQKTFWVARFGVVVDPFGVAWEISCAQV